MGYIKKLKRMRNTIAKRTGYKLNEIEKNKLLIDYLWEHYVHGVVLIEYNQYEFYKKKSRERREYVCFREFEKRESDLKCECCQALWQGNSQHKFCGRYF